MQRRSILQVLLIAPFVALLRRLGLLRKPNAWVDGREDYVEARTLKGLDRDQPFTMAFWYKADEPGTVKVFTPKVKIEFDPNPGRFNDGKWHHFVIPAPKQDRS